MADPGAFLRNGRDPHAETLRSIVAAALSPKEPPVARPASGNPMAAIYKALGLTNVRSFRLDAPADGLVTITVQQYAIQDQLAAMAGEMVTRTYSLRELPPVQEQAAPVDAVKRAMELMMVPKSQLPPLAAEFAQHMCRKVGLCAETFLTSFAVYAQCVEFLPCDDPLYTARGEDIEWFKQRIQENVRETELAWARELEEKRAIKST